MDGFVPSFAGLFFDLSYSITLELLASVPPVVCTVFERLGNTMHGLIPPCSRIGTQKIWNFLAQRHIRPDQISITFPPYFLQQETPFFAVIYTATYQQHISCHSYTDALLSLSLCEPALHCNKLIISKKLMSYFTQSGNSDPKQN